VRRSASVRRYYRNTLRGKAQRPIAATAFPYKKVFASLQRSRPFFGYFFPAKRKKVTAATRSGTSAHTPAPPVNKHQA
jgi:hypothetical protein